MDRLDRFFDYGVKKGWNIRRNELMSKYTTFKIGGPVDLLVEISCEEDLCRAVRKCREWEMPYQVIGKGSNLLVSDKGIEGVAFLLIGDLAVISMAGEGRIICGAGASLARLCSFALSEELSGLEFAWGIPGSVGGAAFMNAGAYGGEMRDVLLSCRHVTPLGQIGERKKDELMLGYRRSAYTDSGDIITYVEVGLNPDSMVEIKARMDDYMGRRKLKQPLEYPSAGSVFKRPPGYFAGALIENSGLKGHTIGGAQVSEKHAGFIINKGNATCRDVEMLIEYIKKKVKADSGVELECEIKAIGKE